jgi:hypothetical protein
MGAGLQDRAGRSNAFPALGSFLKMSADSQWRTSSNEGACLVRWPYG